MRSGLFLDLGGTLVRVENDEIYTDRDGNVEFLPNIVAVLKSRAREFDAVFIVTNQAGIEDGILSLEVSNSFVHQVNDAVGGMITDFWACPRRGSSYRKPNPGMIEGLADKHYIALERSVMVGDSDSDRQAALSVGVGSFVWADEFFSR